MVISWRSLLAVFVLAILTIPSNVYKLPGQLPFDLEIYRVVAAIVLLMWLTALLVDPGARLRRSPIDLPLALLAAAVLISLLVNAGGPELETGLSGPVKAAIFFASFICIYYFVVSTFTKTADVESALKFMVLLAAVVGAFGIVERLTGYNIFRHLHEWIPILRLSGEQDVMMRGGIRVAGSLAHPIAFSAILAMIFPLAVHYWQAAADSRSRTVFALATGLISSALVLTGSRTGFVALAAVMFVLLAGERKWRKALISGLLVTFFLVHMVFPGALGTIKRTLSLSYIQESEIGNENGRLEDYPRIRAEFVKRPMFGLGYDAFNPQDYFFVDNQYLKFLVEIGLFGTLALLLLFYRAFIEMWRAARAPGGRNTTLPLAIAASGAAFISATATFDTFGFSQVPYMYFIITALGFAWLIDRGEDSWRQNNTLLET